MPKFKLSSLSLIQNNKGVTMPQLLKDIFILDDSMILDVIPGHFARVFDAKDLREKQKQFAFKILRIEHIDKQDYYQRFVTECELLIELENVKNCINYMPLVKLSDCGYVSDITQYDSTYPTNERRLDMPDEGLVISCKKEVAKFKDLMLEMYTKKWRPYVTLARLDSKNCLETRLFANDRDPRMLPLPAHEVISLGLQFLALLQTMHENKAVYLDHKPAHAFWDGEQLTVIDLNVSEKIEHLAEEEQKRKKSYDIYCLIRGVLYPALTGQTIHISGMNISQSGTTAEQRHNLLTQSLRENLDFSMCSSQHLTLVNTLRELGDSHNPIDASLAIKKLWLCAEEFGYLKINELISKPHREDLQHVKKAMKYLREAEDSIEKARLELLEALVVSNLDSVASLEWRSLKANVERFSTPRIIP